LATARQKAIEIDTLTAHFSQKQEGLALLLAAEDLRGMDNEDDSVYEML
jgi:hypothetical protein